MRHQPRVIDQTLDTTKTLGKREDAAALEHSSCLFQPTLDPKAHDPAESVLHLPLRQLMLRMARQARIEHMPDSRMLLQPSSNMQRALTRLPHAQRQRLQATQREKTIERA